MALNPAATIDCLYFGDRLQQIVGGFSAAELHMLGYFACLLSLYRRAPLADWGYQFIGTKCGAPFSKDVEESCNVLLNGGYFIVEGNRLNFTTLAGERLQQLSFLDLFKKRRESLVGAASAVVAFPLGIVREALSNEPDLQRARLVPLNRELLETAAVESIYEQFDVLKSAFGDIHDDLRLPAVAWITALYQSDELAMAAAT